MNTPVSIYLADDHQIVIDGLRLLISSEASMKVVGSATNGKVAKEEIINKRPDIALIDLRMPGLEGMELIYILRKIVPDTKFIILSMHDNQRYMKDAMNGGASGYLLKNSGKTELMKCFNAVLDGNTYFPNIQSARNITKSPFTPRETEILKLVLDEYTTAEIAAKLSLSHHTVDVHRKSIVRKANTKTPLGLSKFLQENQIEL